MRKTTIELAKQKDEAAVDALLSSLDSVLTKTVGLEFKSFDSMYDTEDIVNELRYRILSKLDKYDSDKEFVPWVRAVAKHHVRDLVARLRAQRVYPESGLHSLDVSTSDATEGRVDNLYDHLADQLPTAERNLSRKEARSALYAAIAMLDEPDRTAVKIRYLEGEGVSVVAERTEKTYKAAEAILRRAKQKLKTHLGRASQYLSSG